MMCTVDVDQLRPRATALLHAMAGPGAAFRPGQLEAIDALVDGRRVLLVQRTGWGKSAVYFLATRLLRDAGAGPTLLVSPLLALMRNQIDMAARAGVTAATLNSANREDWDRVEASIEAGEVDLLLISPERLNNDRFRATVLPALAEQVGCLVIDEVHCISDWGHDFRPDYRRLARVIEQLPRGVPVLGATATANDRVVRDIGEQLGADLLVVRGPLGRDSLALAVHDLPDPAARLAWLAEAVPRLPGSGIVYCLTVADAQRVAGWLSSRGLVATAYTGGDEDGDRIRVEADLLANRVKVVAATSALGMGFDKPDLGFVVHYQSPGSAIAYYQQVGRAGRALDDAAGVLLRGAEDADIQDWFIRTAFPPRDQAEAVVDLLAAADGPVSPTKVQAQVNVRATRLDAMLKVLEVEGAVARERGGYTRTSAPWEFDEERAIEVTAARRAEQRQMRQYAATSACRMAFLREALDDPEAEPCGRCDNCRGAPPVSVELAPALVAEAERFLRGGGIAIEPRRQWPTGLGEVRGRFDALLECGQALTRAGSGGWAPLANRGREVDGRFADELVAAAAELVRDRWRPAVSLVTWVPSARRPGLVPDLAARLAAVLGLPCEDLIELARPTEPQHRMENSAQQVRNLFGAFSARRVLDGEAVLLVDDLVDSRWTLTMAGLELLAAGAGAVHPFALVAAAGG